MHSLGAVISSIVPFLLLVLLLVLGYLSGLILTHQVFRKLITKSGVGLMVLGISWFVFFSLTGFSLFISLVTGLKPFQVFILTVLGTTLISWPWGNRTPTSNFSWILPLIRAGYRQNKVLAIFPLLFIYAVTIHNTFVFRSILPGDLGQNIGSLHTGRYTIIGEVIRACNKVPIVRENIGQTFFAANLGEFWQYSLVEIRSFINFSTLMALCIFLTGALKYIQPSISRFRLLQSLLIMFLGTYSLSLAFTLINDSGNPLAFVGYADTLFGVFLVLIIPLLFHFRHEINYKWLIAIVTLFFVEAYIASPQGLILTVPSLFFLVSMNYKQPKLRQFIVKILISLSLALLIWHGSIGMLKFNSAGLNQEIPGTMTISESGFTDLFSSENLSPGMPFLVGNMKTLHEIDPKIIDLAKNAQSDFRDPQRFLWDIEQIMISTSRVIFWPLIGLFLSAMLLRRKKNLSNSFDFDLLSDLSKFAAPLFLAGISASFFFAPPNAKWEMSRFLFLPLNLMMLLLVLAFNIIGSNRKGAHRLISLVSVLLVVPSIVFSSASLIQFLTRTPTIPAVSTDFGQIGFFEMPLEIPCSSWGFSDATESN